MFLEILLPTYNRVNELKMSLSSLMAQSDEDWKATVILDHPEFGNRAKILNIIHSFYDDRIGYIITDRRYNDWGHSLRQIGKQQSEADYVIGTGDDNYYTPNLVKELKLAAISNPGMIYWDMVHSHFNYQYFKCYPAYGQIDMGAFATRTDLAKQIPLTTNYAADGDFIEDFKKKFPNERIVKIDKILFVHN
jgi:glycosyltransferase involved in cell wall biosynthesis